MKISDFKAELPFPDLFPKEWDGLVGPRDFMCFRNLEHFKYEVEKLTQRKDDYCDITYADALKKLMLGESDFPEAEQVSIRNLVRSNLHKRGLITEEVYEAFQYSVNGTAVGVDIGKYVAGEPDCVITPARQYVDFFYELFISISYPHHVTNKAIRKNTAKLLATVEELERQHIFIKITLVLPIKGCSSVRSGNFFSSIPLFSHKDPKSVATMSSVVNDRLLRKFYFALLEDLYEDKLNSGYGRPMELPTAMNIGSAFDEIEFFSNVLELVGADGH